MEQFTHVARAGVVFLDSGALGQYTWWDVKQFGIALSGQTRWRGIETEKEFKPCNFLTGELSYGVVQCMLHVRRFHAW